MELATPDVNIYSFILEDDPDVLEIVENLLKQNGIHDYRLFTSGVDLLGSLTADIHVCLIDHYLDGGLTGLEVLREIKKTSVDSFVIIMSGQQNFDIVVEYTNNGADRYIDKNKPDYLNKLIDFLTIGIKESKKRYEELQAIKARLERLNNITL